MWASTRGLADLVSGCLILRSAPSPPFCLFERRPQRSASLPFPAGIENASPSRPLAAPLTILFLVDLHASSPEVRTWKSGEDNNPKRPMKEMPRQLLSRSEGVQ